MNHRRIFANSAEILLVAARRVARVSVRGYAGTSTGSGWSPQVKRAVNQRIDEAVGHPEEKDVLH